MLVTLLKSFTWLSLFFCFLGIMDKVSADVITRWLEIGDPGNFEHTAIARDGTSGYGAVDYRFRISEFEVTNSQYTVFLNAVAATDLNALYRTDMQGNIRGGISRTGSNGRYSYSIKSNMGNRPVNYVSWFDAARYTNWLHNGQPSGVQDASTTEDGAYTFIGFETVGPRNPGATVFLPNEHEWHKAAFYEPEAVTDDGDEWWFYPTRSDFLPANALVDVNGMVTNSAPNVVNYGRISNWNGSTIGNVTNVGATGSQSYYGVKDMGGNVFEWVEADPTKPDPFEAGLYVVRGGSFSNTSDHIRSTERNTGPHLDENGNLIPGEGHIHNIPGGFVGIRVAAAVLPIPADINGDGYVDNADAGILITNWGLEGLTFSEGNLNGDNFIDNADAGILIANWNNNSTPSLTTIPEPSCIVLGTFAILFASILRRSRIRY